MNKRNVGIDLLRITSMYMVVVLHVMGLGGVLSNIAFLSDKYIVSWFIEIAMYCAVNCYAIITGYVYYGKEQKWENIIYLWIQTFFYSVGIAIVICLFSKRDDISMKEMIKLFFPLSSNRYWYFSSYVGMFLFIPLLNCLVEKCERKILQTSLIIITLFLSVPTVIFYSDPFVLNYGYSTIWLVILYLIGAYYKKYEGVYRKKRYYVLGYAGCVLGTTVFKILITYVAKNIGVELPGSFLATYITPTILVAAICMFHVFKNIKIKRVWLIKTIALLGSASYGVFLIHVHPIVIQKFLSNRFVWITEKPVWLMTIIILSVATAIYFLCLPIELFRKFIFKICKINLCSKTVVGIVSKMICKVSEMKEKKKRE